MTSEPRISAVLGFVLATALLSAGPAAAEDALWLRYPAISPDGGSIVFSYHGDLWKVPSEGGLATPLTVHPGHDFMPVWSPDGSQLAFASDRYGNLDVFVMPSEGGEATRLTFHSADDEPTSFTPDGDSILFSSARLDAASCVQFPTRAQPELYRVAVRGGMPAQVLTTPAEYAVWSPDGTRLAYSDRKGYEMEWRKHDDSSFARDLWLWDPGDDVHQRLTGFGVDDRQPVWSPDGASLYYLSEASGSFNVWRLETADPERAQQVTDHQVHPVRFLSASRAGDLCYAFDGRLWVRPAGAVESRPVSVRIATDRRHNLVEHVDVERQVGELDVSPDGDEIAFVARGEVFVTSTEHGTTRRITDTPEQERSVSFSPDGRSLVYASERGGSWNVYRTDLTDEDEPDFFNATALEERVVVATDAEEFQPAFSPDGSEVAYLEDRTTLKVVNVASGESREILPGDLSYSYADGDQWYRWSPDGRWFLVEFLSPTRWSSEIGLVAADGSGEVRNLTRSGYEDVAPRWAGDGEVVVWLTDRHGDRVQAGWPSQFDVYAAFLTAEAWDRHQLTEAELAQVEAAEKKEKKKDTGIDGKDGDDDADDGKPKLPDPVAIELEGLEDRTARLSLHSADLAGALLTPDRETLVYLARFEKGYDLWTHEPRSKETKRVAKLDADDAGGLQLDGDGKNAFLLADHKLMKVELDSGKVSPVKLEASVQLDAAAERAYLFEHAWRQTREKFYDPDMHGVDWDAMKPAYERFLPHIDNGRDFAELVSEMQGELNASHTGGRYRPRRPNADETASLGFFPDPDWQQDGVRIVEVIQGGPLQQAGTRISAGTVIEAIGGEPIAAGANWYPLLDRTAGTVVRLALRDPASGDQWEETVKPVSQLEEARLLYTRWTRSRRSEVDRLSDGRLGYAHIRGMNDRAYREVFEEVFGKATEKEGIVLDTRFNGGGNLVEALTVFLTGEVYARNVARGQQVGVEPWLRWTKPSVVVMNEGNYSDAHCFPAAYTTLGIGDTVGMQVPGTCTSVWWERLQDPSLVFGIPQVGMLDNDGNYLENKHLDPDHQVDNDPALEAAGRDQQLEMAVKVLLQELDG